MKKKLLIILISAISVLTENAFPQARVVLNGVNISIYGDTLSIKGSLIVNANSIYGSNIYNAGTIIVTDSVFSGVLDLFKSSAVNCIGNLILNGNEQQVFKGSPFWLNHLIINNSRGLKLCQNITVLGDLIFEVGSINLNGNNISLFDLDPEINLYSGSLVHESNQSHLYDNSSILPGGKVNSYVKSTNSYIMPGNLGMDIQKTSGELYLERGHMVIPKAGRGSIRKYFNIQSSDDQTIDIKFHYLDSADLAGSDLEKQNLKLFSSPLNSSSYYFEGGSHDLSEQVIYKEGLKQNRQFTLSDEHCPDPPPIGFIMDTLNICVGDSTVLHSIYPSFIHTWFKHDISILDTSDILRIKNTETGTEKYYLQIFDRRGCTNIDSVIVINRPLPVPLFETPSSACQSDSLLLISQSSIVTGGMSQRWIINHTDTLEGPTNYLPLNYSGNWNLSLVCESEYGCYSEISKSLIVNPLPEANYRYQDLCTDRKILFINNSVIPSPAFIAQCNWKINDQLIEKDNWPDELNAMAYAFPVAGANKISLEAVSGAGCKNEYSQVLNVYDPIKANFSYEGHCEGNSVVFRSQPVGGSHPFQFLWKINDVPVSTDTSFAFKFSGPGLFEVTLICSSANQCTDSTTENIVIYPKPNPAFTYSNLCSGQTVTFTNSTSDSLLYNWTIDGTESNETNPSYIFSKEGIIDAKLRVTTTAGCRDSIQEKIIVMPSPSATFKVPEICSGDTLRVIPEFSSDSLGVLWLLNGEQFSTIPVLNVSMGLAAGNYVLGLKIISTNGCSNLTEEMLTINGLPITDLPAGITTCGDHYFLDAGTDAQEYKWSTGDTTHLIVVTQPGTYTVHITNSEGCSIEAASQVDLNSNVQPDLGTNRKACNSTFLHSGFPDALCEWSTGETGESIVARETGWYKVKVTDQNRCSGVDSVFINILASPLFDLGPDQIICEETPVLIGQTNDKWTYKWDSGQDEAIISVTSSGIYHCSIKNEDGCEATDSVGVWFRFIPRPDLPEKVNACGSVVLTAGPAGYIYSWNDMDTSRVKVITQSGNFNVNLGNGYCTKMANIEVNLAPLPKFDLGDDLIECEGVMVKLMPLTIDWKNTYNWNSGSVGAVIQTLQGGMFILTATSPAGCKFSDSIVINRLPLPEIKLEDEYILCPSDSIILFSGDNNKTCKWQSGNTLIGTEPYMLFDTTGIFNLIVWDEYGCQNQHSFNILPSPWKIYSKYLVASEACENDTLVFINLSGPEPFGSFWAFGDGQWSLEQDAQHSYTRSNRYVSALQVNNGYCRPKASKEILITPAAKQNKQSVAAGETNGRTILSFRAYPNPAKDLVYLEAVFNHHTDANLVVYNMQAMAVYRKSYHKVEELSAALEAGMLPPGLYIVLLHTNDDSKSIKLVIL